MFDYGSRYVYEWKESIYLSQSFKGMKMYLIQQTGDGDVDIVNDWVEIDQVDLYKA